MKLWIELDQDRYETLLKNKVLVANEEKIKETWFDMPNFIKSYQWLSKKMKDMNLLSKENYPLWAWEKRPSYHDFKKEIPKDGYLYLLEINKNKKEVLLTNYQAWHLILYGSFLPKTQKESSVFDIEVKDAQICVWTDSLTPENSETSYKLDKELKTKIIKSWDNVINLKNKYWGDILQATFEELRLEEVVSVRRYSLTEKVSKLDF